MYQLMDYSEDTRDGLKVLWREAVELSFKPFCLVAIVGSFFDLHTLSVLCWGTNIPMNKQKIDLYELQSGTGGLKLKYHILPYHSINGCRIFQKMFL